MKDKELRKLIGSRAKQRRTELNLTQPYIAEKMGVTASTIQRYEAGTIDNTKKMVLEGLSEALHVSVEWLKGETDEYETDITDKRELQIRDAGISKDWGKVKQKYERNYRNTEWGILWVILWNLWMCYRQYPYDNTFWKKEIQLYLTGDARPAFCDL